MIARNDKGGSIDVWNLLAQPVDPAAIAWRQDGKVIARDGKFFARFVCYIEANTVRERLDTFVPGQWDLTLELLPPMPGNDDPDSVCAFKARLQILGVVREDVGHGKDYKQAATDAFKRVGVRFGIAHELYAYEQNWVQVDGDSKYPKPLEDPGIAYARRFGNGSVSDHRPSSTTPVERGPAPAPTQKASAPASRTVERAPVDDGSYTQTSDEPQPSCPRCGGKVWDNRLSKRNPKAPDFKCRDRSCDGVIWPPRRGTSAPVAEYDDEAFPGDPGPSKLPLLDSSPLGMSVDDIPF
jgi:hypothetical protein